ncbi:hypothetical protein EYC84_011885 [Monilinia fructicola]|uniref:glutaminase n=1 Tax=Monilinia fructicola TaxID=38448 RepID=A0A5M9J627_MONFR|nr:hypothetical protein EYC84_011885 [Monilinia fructicola]
MANFPSFTVTIGVLALQGAFNEHIQLLRSASQILATKFQTTSHQTHDLDIKYHFIEVRTESELDSCDALIIPGGESTAISLVAQRSGLLEPLRDFVKVHRRPTWGTCAGLILLSESANRTKAGGQELIGGLDVRVNRNHFGRQVESFSADLNLPFLSSLSPTLNPRLPLSPQSLSERPSWSNSSQARKPPAPPPHPQSPHPPSPTPPPAPTPPSKFSPHSLAAHPPSSTQHQSRTQPRCRNRRHSSHRCIYKVDPPTLIPRHARSINVEDTSSFYNSNQSATTAVAPGGPAERHPGDHGHDHDLHYSSEDWQNFLESFHHPRDAR